MVKTEYQQRGVLTQRIKDKSIELFGYEMTVRELRLIPYLQYKMVNEQKLNLEQITEEEMEILSKWVAKGYILDGVTQSGRPMISKDVKLKITKEFWNSLLEILWLGFVDLD